MKVYNIQHYDDFVQAVFDCGFSMGGGNSEGIFSVIPWSWNEAPPYDTAVSWHTGDPATDPWEWRMRVLDEGSDIAYAKVFFKKSGFITRDWYPYFLAARRAGRSLDEAYANGTVSQEARRIYDVIRESGACPVHAIKPLAGFSSEDSARFERALVDLQMRLFITMCGRQQKISQQGQEYGWSSTVFCTTEQFWGSDIFGQSADITRQAALDRITGQILRLNPAAEPRKISRFILG